MSGTNMTEEEQYTRAVCELNSLMRSSELMKDVILNRKKYMLLHLPHLRKLLTSLSISQADLDQLSVIHVAGTKGKGSTCGYTESILRHHGYRTLFYCSPHVLEVRERIRINGQPVSCRTFADYFWEVYNKLKHLKDPDNSVLHFYNFLMVLGLYVSVKEHQAGNIDVVVMECMVGGEHDYSNVFSHPVVCGVTSLGLDHTASLGNTVGEIAWHKAGIFKKNVPAFTMDQFPEAMSTLKERAQEKQTVLGFCPPLDAYGDDIQLGVSGEVQKLNASLALQLSRTWLEQKENRPKRDISKFEVDAFELEKADREGLKNVDSPGKDHVIKLDGMTVYLDGAHTLESLKHCLQWYDSKTRAECKSLAGEGKISNNTIVRKVFIFSKTAERDTKRLISPFTEYPFDDVMMCANITGSKETSLDHQAISETTEQKTASAQENLDSWKEMKEGINNISSDVKQQLIFSDSIADTVQRLTNNRLGGDETKDTFVQVLVTGSTSFMGKYLRYLDQLVSASK